MRDTFAFGAHSPARERQAIRGCSSPKRSLNDERIDESGEPDIDNMVFPPVQLNMLFPDLPLVQKHFKKGMLTGAIKG